jgi:hypothetical protein
VFKITIPLFKPTKLARVVNYLCKHSAFKFVIISSDQVMECEEVIPNLRDFIGWGQSAYLLSIGTKKIAFVIEDWYIDAKIPFLYKLLGYFSNLPLSTDIRISDLSLSGVSIPVTDKKLKKKLYKKAVEINNYIESLKHEEVLDRILSDIENEDLLRLDNIVKSYNKRLYKS